MKNNQRFDDNSSTDEAMHVATAMMDAFDEMKAGDCPKPTPKISPGSLEVGDAVWLNSGSPRLTVVHIEGDRMCEVTWFSCEMNHHANFPEQSLCKTAPKFHD